MKLLITFNPTRLKTVKNSQPKFSKLANKEEELPEFPCSVCGARELNYHKFCCSGGLWQIICHDQTEGNSHCHTLHQVQGNLKINKKIKYGAEKTEVAIEKLGQTFNQN